MVKKAFNLTEVLLVLAIIATISIISLPSIKSSSDDYRGMYYTAYNALVQAVGNAALEWNPNCTCTEFENLNEEMLHETCWTKACWDRFEEDSKGNSADLGIAREYPGFLMGDPTIGNFDGYATDSYFCKTLTSKLNTINETTECQYFINAYANKNKDGEDLDYSTGIDFKTAFCNRHVTRPSEYDFDNVEKCEYEIQPSFITANGQRFYISKLLSTNADSREFLNTTGEQKINREFFRLVAVDLNGNNGPNTQLQKNSGKLPDIVLFGLRSNGTVVPLGLPEFNRNYASAIVQYPKQLKAFDEDGNIITNNEKQSSALPLYDAKVKAWGIHAGSGADINSDVAYGQVFSEMEPLSYSPLLYQMSIACRPTKSGGEAPQAGSTCPTNRYIDELLARIVTQFTFDKNGSSQRVMQNPESPTADTAHGCSFRYSRCSVQIIDGTK